MSTDTISVQGALGFRWVMGALGASGPPVGESLWAPNCVYLPGPTQNPQKGQCTTSCTTSMHHPPVYLAGPKKRVNVPPHVPPHVPPQCTNLVSTSLDPIRVTVPPDNA